MVTLFQTLHSLSYVTADRVKTLKDEKGASAIEYAILVAVIAVVVIAAIATLGDKITNLFDSIDVSKAGTTPAAPTT